MSSIINYAKKVVVPSQKLQQKKKRIANKGMRLGKPEYEKISYSWF